jgi:hypothetical protein
MLKIMDNIADAVAGIAITAAGGLYLFTETCYRAQRPIRNEVTVWVQAPEN